MPKRKNFRKLTTPGGRKRTTNFTPQERAKIISRANEVGAIQAAQEFGTSWQAVTAWQRDLLHRQAVAIVSGEDTNTKFNHSPFRRSKAGARPRPFNDKRQESIQRAVEILTRVEDVKVNKPVLHIPDDDEEFFYEEEIRQPEPAPVKVEVVKAAPEVKDVKDVKEVKEVKEVKAPEKVQPVKLAVPDTSVVNYGMTEVEFENALLKAKLASLTEQADRLKATLEILVN